MKRRVPLFLVPLVAAAAIAVGSMADPGATRRSYAADPVPPSPAPTPAPTPPAPKPPAPVPVAKLYLKVPATVAATAGEPVVLKVDTNAKRVEFWSPDGIKEWNFVKELTGNDRLPNTFPIRAPAKDGTYRIYAYGFNGTALTPASDDNVIRVVVGGTPIPVPPIPNPTPPPTPNPAPPEPVAPIPLPGFRALIVYESDAVTKLPPSQQAVLYGKTVRDYLDTHCVAGPDGKTREYRIFDQDADANADSVVWSAAMKRPRASVPWCILSNGKTGYEGPLPKTEAEFLTLAKKYGGD